MEIGIFFRAFEFADAKLVNDLRKIDEFENLIGGNRRFVSSARDEKWIESLMLNDYQDKFYVAICEKESKNIIGYTSVSDIDHVNKSCTWGGIKLHPEFNGKGFATQTGLLIMKYVFDELNMERFVGECLEDHIVSKKLMKKMGLQVEALKRHSLFKNGKYHNQCVFSILKEEFQIVKKDFNL